MVLFTIPNHKNFIAIKYWKGQKYKQLPEVIRRTYLSKFTFSRKS